MEDLTLNCKKKAVIIGASTQTEEEVEEGMATFLPYVLNMVVAFGFFKNKKIKKKGCCQHSLHVMEAAVEVTSSHVFLMILWRAMKESSPPVKTLTNFPKRLVSARLSSKCKGLFFSFWIRSAAFLSRNRFFL